MESLNKIVDRVDDISFYPQTHISLEHQLLVAEMAANRLGLYDAADLLRRARDDEAPTL